MIYAGKLAILDSLRTNMQVLNKESEVSDEALAGFVNAYMMYIEEEANKPIYEESDGHYIDKSSDILKNSMKKGFSLPFENNGKIEARIAGLENVLATEELAFLNNKELSNSINSVYKAIGFCDQSETIIAKLTKENKNKYDEIGISKLLDSADKKERAQSKKVEEEAKGNKELASIRKFVIEASKVRLEKRAKRTEDDDYVLANADKISEIEIFKREGKPYFKVTADGKSSLLSLATHKGSYAFSNIDTPTIKGMINKTYAAIEANGGIISFFNDDKKSTSVKGVLKEEEFVKKLGLQVKEIDKEQLEKELNAYNVFVVVKNVENADKLLNKLKEKYNYLSNEKKINGFEDSQKKMQKIIAKELRAIKENLEGSVEKRESPEILRLFAGNKSFWDMLQLVTSEKQAKEVKKQLVDAFKTDAVLWNDVSKNYYYEIKDYANRHSSTVPVEYMMSNRKDVTAALRKGNPTFSDKLLKLVYMRSLEMSVLSKGTVEKHNEMNEAMSGLGYNIKLEEIKAEANGEDTLRSRPLTLMLRSLADGRKLEDTLNEIKNDDEYFEAKDYIKGNAKKIKSLLGKDPNFQKLIGNFIEGGESTTDNLKRTPYQRRYEELGFLCAISSNKSFKDVDDALFAGMAIQQKFKDKDNYLFTKYMEIFFDEKIGLHEENKIKELKEKYKWEEFKQANKKEADAVAADFVKNAKNPENLMISLLNKGAWPADCGNFSVHHNKPLKYAVCSSTPLTYNDADNLVVTIQWKPWEDDKHELAHLTTITGAEAAASYLVQENGELVRCKREDLAKDMSVYCEKPLVKNKHDKFVDLIPENTLYVSSSGVTVSSAKLPELAFLKTKEKGNDFGGNGGLGF